MVERDKISIVKLADHFLQLTLTRLSGEACIEEYVAVGEVDDDSDVGNSDCNLEIELLISAREAVKLLDRIT